MERIAIALVVRPHGIRGEVSAQTLSDHPERYEALDSVWLTREGREVEYRVERCRFHKDRLLLKLAGVDDMDQAESLRGATIAVNPGDRWPLPEDEYYWNDLVGLRAEDPQGGALGTVAKVERAAASDLLVIQGADGSRFLVPFVSEHVLQVEPREGRLVLKLLPGMIEGGES